AALLDPLGPPAVHDPDVLVVVQLEEPVGVGGPPVVAVAVDDHGRVGGDPQAGGERGEGLRPDEVARDLVVAVGLPVELQGAREPRPSLPRMFSRCRSAVRSEITSSWAISRLPSPRRIKRATSHSRWLSGPDSAASPRPGGISFAASTSGITASTGVPRPSSV